MKIFLIHASAGQGHKMVAEAIKGAAVQAYGKENVRIIDLLDFSSNFFRLIYARGYIFAISKLSWLWGILFFLADTKYLKLINVNCRRFTNKLFCRNLLDFIRKEDPDIVISTHFLVNELISLLKEDGQIKSKLISMVTDFGVHNFWLAKNVDIYATACDKTKEILISKNVNSKIVRVIGIPVRKQFQRILDKNEAKVKLGLKEEEFTALILTGGLGIGPIHKIVRLLEDRINVVVVCGNNKQLSQKLKELDYNNLVVLGWVEAIEEVMAAADIVITKPGGATISECLVMDLPMIFFSIIPGQEYQNSQIITEYGFSLILKDPEDIKEKILSLKDNQDEIKAISAKIRAFKFRDSANKVLELINE